MSASPLGAAPVGRAALLVGVASAAFATSAPFARLAAPTHPLWIAFGRLLVAAILLAAIDARAMLRSFRALSLRHRATVILAGGLLAAHFALFQWGLTATSLPAAVSLVSLEPLAVVVAAWLLFSIRPRRLEQIGIGLATAGAVVISRGAGEGEHRLLGDLLVLGSVTLFGLYVACARGLRNALPAAHYAPLVYASASASLAIVLPFVPLAPDAALTALPTNAFVFVGLLGVVPTVIGHTLVQTGARTLSPSVIALVSPGETLGSMVLFAILFGVAPTALEAAGALLILAGAGLAIWAQRARTRAVSS
ncbi:MAG: DMT family transporter [Polyangiaceae bacterium]